MKKYIVVYQNGECVQTDDLLNIKSSVGVVATIRTEDITRHYNYEWSEIPTVQL